MSLLVAGAVVVVLVLVLVAALGVYCGRRSGKAPAPLKTPVRGARANSRFEHANPMAGKEVV